MSLPINFLKTLEQKTDAALFEMFENSADYTPEALDAALEEIKRRSLPTEQALQQKSLSTLRAVSQDGYCTPKLIRINGCGFTHIGQSDLREDGSFVSTVWLTVVLLPIIPLRSERIQRLSSASYRVVERLKLNIWQVARTYLFALTTVSFLASMITGAILFQAEKRPDTSALVFLGCLIGVFLLSLISIIKWPQK